MAFEEKDVYTNCREDTMRVERERRTGLDMLSHLRDEIHLYLNQTRLPSARADQHPMNGEDIRQRIGQAKKEIAKL